MTQDVARPDNRAELTRACCAIARTAGAAIMKVYAGEFDVERKGDNSPLTAADLAAHHAIVDGLALLTPQIPVLSEESAEQVAWPLRRQWARYWLVDPLDGTREFVKRNGEFTVNIALIEDHKPVIGIIYSPVSRILYFASIDSGSFKVTGHHVLDQLNNNNLDIEKLIAISKKLPLQV